MNGVREQYSAFALQEAQKELQSLVCIDDRREIVECVRHIFGACLVPLD